MYVSAVMEDMEDFIIESSAHNLLALGNFFLGMFCCFCVGGVRVLIYLEFMAWLEKTK